MSYIFVKNEIEKALNRKYNGKLKDFTKFSVEADVQQVLLRLKKEKRIIDFTPFRVQIKNNIVKVRGDFYIPIGKITLEWEINL